MSKTNFSYNINLSLSYSQLLSILKQLNIEQKIVIEKELEKDTLLVRAKKISETIKKNTLTMDDIIKEVKQTRKERYEKK